MSVPGARRWAILAAVLCLARAPADAEPRTADCSGDAVVAINELIGCVTIALGTAALTIYPACDANGDGVVGINELVRAVTRALHGCPPPSATAPPPTVTPPSMLSATPTVTAVPTTAGATETANATTTQTATATRTRTPTQVRSGTPGSVGGRFREVAVSAQGATRAALLDLDWFALLDEAAMQADTDPRTAPPCGSGATSRCEVSAGTSLHTVDYAGCTTTVGGHQMIRSGRVARAVSNPHFCQDGVIGPADTVTAELQAYELTETAGEEALARLAATLTISRTGLGIAGCAGGDAEETFDGTVEVRCSDATDSFTCPRRGADVQLGPAALRRRRHSTDDPCRRVAVIDGPMAVSNAATAEAFTQVFTGLQLEEQALPEAGTRAMTMNGEFRTDCLGAVTVSTDAPMVIGAENACPLSGALSIARPGSPAAPSTGFLRNEERLGLAAGAPPAPSGFRQRLFRAARGQVYQVLQYVADEADNGAEALQITSVVGSLGDGVAACVNTSGASSVPTAVTAAPFGQAFPLDAVFTSGPIDSAAPPCFNRNAAAGNGQICFGSGCTVDCSCPMGMACTVFTLGVGDDPAGIPITGAESGLPPASLAQLGVPSPPCDGFGGRAAYRFGAVGPTTDRSLCGPVPADGFSLGSGEAVVFAYDAKALEVFNAGAAGLLIDRDGVEPFNCPSAVFVLSPGRATTDTAPAPRAEFVEGRLELHYADRSGSGTPPDRRFATCDEGARIACEAAPLPTSTRDPERPCGAVGLEASAELSVVGSTRGHTDAASGASCGWGGGIGAPDIVYEYVAPQTGTYDVDLAASDFEPYLYARADSCLPGGEELGCTDQSNGSHDRHLTLSLADHQRVAIIVDGASEQGGDFTLRVQCQPDLAIRSLGVPEIATVLSPVAVAAEITNQGGCAAGAFEVEIAYARDAAGVVPLSLVPVRCAFDGLPAGQSVICAPADGLPVPPAAPDNYFVVARVDPPDAIAERDEQNNLAAAATQILAAQGVALTQQIFRADDGTVYQLVEAVPQPVAAPASRFRITTLAVSSPSQAEICETAGTVAGTPLRAAAASSAQLDLTQILRTGILHPNDFGTPRFLAGQSGRLVIGAASGRLQICSAAGDCDAGAVPLLSLSQAGGGLPAACVATAPGGSYCPFTTVPTTVAFGVPQSGGVCASSLPTQIGSESQLCAANQTVPGGFTLAPGEAVVFVARPGPRAVSVAVGALGIAGPGTGCAAGQFASAETRRDNSDAFPLLSVIEAVRTYATTALGVSPDGQHVYAAGDGALSVLQRGEDGRLGLIQTEGEPNLSAGSVTVSPDGKVVYVAEFVVDVLARQATTGRVELAYRDAGGAWTLISAALSPDGRHLYANGADANLNRLLATFALEPTTGALVLLSTLGEEDLHLGIGLGKAAIALSPDGRFVDVDVLRPASSSALGGRLLGTSTYIETTLSFYRDAATGRLRQASRLDHGAAELRGLDIGGAAITPSLDGQHLYVASLPDAITVLGRDAANGELRLIESQRDGVSGVDGLAGVRSVSMSPDGRNIYVAGDTDKAIAVFNLEAETGALRFLAAERDGLQDRGTLGPLAASPDGQYLYAAVGHEIAVFSRQTETGALQFLDAADRLPGAEGLEAPRAVAVSPDGRHVYVASSRSVAGSFVDGTLAAFARDAQAGTLRYVELQRDGAGGVQGLVGASALAVSPDGLHVYATSASGNSVAAFARDATTGGLRFVDLVRDGAGGVDGLAGADALAVSPDGKAVYVIGPADNAVAVFARQAATGRLTFVEAERRSLDGPRALVISPDGQNVYVASELNDKAVVFTRNQTTAALDFVEAEGRQIDHPQGIAASADGRHVYVHGAYPGSADIQVFERLASGALRFVEVEPSDTGLLSISPDGGYVYVVDDDAGFTVFARTPATGALDQVGPGSLEQLYSGINALAPSPDGRQLYATFDYVFGIKGLLVIRTPGN